MQSSYQSANLLLVAIGVVLFTIIAIILFLSGASMYLFYGCAIIVMALAFYLSFSLSKTNQPEVPGRKKK